ncbi:hypothetical protein cce_4167 [Crocosphaera subtropica ATCC 51142]|uniref:Uncharacterized protein n=1 Tax=Crocosphaera subtropica (strain ATCC 51142 / BH68) TaxID=43989 RepID=B1WRS4_CROS5|nr:hypothetical protein cce_4167 [Crocosphaera subtropica ATCC 51142]
MRHYLSNSFGHVSPDEAFHYLFIPILRQKGHLFNQARN